MAVQGEEVDWLSVVVGVFIPIVMAVAGLYGRILSVLNADITKIKDKLESMATASRDRAEKGDNELWEAINALRDKIEEERAESSRERTNILSSMLTRNEFHRQIDRIVDAFSQQGRLPQRTSVRLRREREEEEGEPGGG